MQRSPALAEKRHSSMKVQFLQSYTFQLAIVRHQPRWHWYVEDVLVASLLDVENEPRAWSRLRMVCLETTVSMSTSKWRRIYNSNTVGVDVAALLIACFSCFCGPGASRTTAANYYVFSDQLCQHRTTSIWLRPACWLLRLFIQPTSLGPMMWPHPKTENYS